MKELPCKYYPGQGYTVPELVSVLMKDISWSNDLAPKFTAKEHDGSNLQLWIDHVEQAQRETGGNYRYAVTFGDSCGDPLIQTDDLLDALTCFYAKWYSMTPEERAGNEQPITSAPPLPPVTIAPATPEHDDSDELLRDTDGASLRHEKAVIAFLNEKHANDHWPYTASLEYPGFIDIRIDAQRNWSFGTTNPTWTGDLMKWQRR